MLKIVIYHDSYKLPASQTQKKLQKKQKKDDDIHRSLRRSKSTIKDIIMSNDWDYWTTFTVNCKHCPLNSDGQKCKNKPCLCDKHNCKRYDLDYVRRKMSLWLNRQSGLKYIIVPEFHKDGALHFHALIANYYGTLKPTGKKTKTGQSIYNSSYAGGYNKFIRLDGNTDAISKYITKQYITKDMPLIYGRKRYWTSRNLNRPTHHVNGLSINNLWQLVKNTKPSFINNSYEVHHIPKPSYLKLASQKNNQLDFSLIID